MPHLASPPNQCYSSPPPPRFLRNLAWPASTTSLVAKPASAALPGSGLSSAFLCLLWLLSSWHPPGLPAFVACSPVEAVTSRLCIAQQAHGNPAILTLPSAGLCSPLYLSVAALKSPTEFHDPRKNLDSDKVIFANRLC